MTHKNSIFNLIGCIQKENIEQGDFQEWLVDQLCAAFNNDAGALCVIKDNGIERAVKTGRDQSAAWGYQPDSTWETCSLGQYLSTDQVRILNNGHSDAIALPDLQLNQKIKSMICQPLTWEGQNLGALVLINPRKGQFGEEDLVTLDSIASSLSFKLFHHRQVQRLKIDNASLEVNQWQLLRSRNILRALFDSIPTSMYIIDRKYNLIAVNMNRANRISTPPNSLVGRRCYDALYQNPDVCADCRVIESLFSSKNTIRTKRQWLSDEDPMEWEISTYPIFDDTNEATQAIILEEDVTEKRRLESTLAQSEKLAAVGQLAAGLAHEINNPLTAIIANTQLLQREFNGDQDKLEMIDLISRAGQRAAQVVRNLLDLARKEEYVFVPTNINKSVEKAISLLQHELITHSVTMVFEAGENLPLVMASEDHMQGVWVNLIANAIDSMDCNYTNEIRVSSQNHGNEVRVIVADTGKGIPAEKLSRIFEPFFTTKAPGRGTGLGLSLCHRVIKQHGGTIHVDSEIGVGTKFTVSIPVEARK